jgi:2-oxoisovalerate dehydrogenase E2 component (dihydrolipoyl transacylase)
MAEAIREFLLPDLGEGLEDAEVVAWRVAEGDRVELNQTLVEVNTAKALVEIPAPWEGVVEHLHAAEGDVVAVGRPLLSIRVEAAAESDSGSGGGQPPSPRRRAVLVGYGVEDEEPDPESAAGRRQERHSTEAGRRGPVPASPPVRRLARELGVDLHGLEGSGPGGRITREDVMAASGVSVEPVDQGPARRPRAESGARLETIPVKGTRRLIAEKMARSIREIPHVTTFLTVDASQIQAFRAEIEAQTGERVSPLPIVVRALVEICQEHPKLNASFAADRSEIVLYRDVHVGIATDTERGLVVTVVRNAQDRGIVDLSAEIARLTDTARKGTATPEELSGSTVTVTNVGTFGAEFGTPIINHPEAAILALGVIEPRAMVAEGRVEARPAATLSLSFDHRVLDGAEAGRALRALGALLQSPFRLGGLLG